MPVVGGEQRTSVRYGYETSRSLRPSGGSRGFMANASARRSFHGPLQTPPPARRKPPATTPSGPQELVSPPLSPRSLGRAMLQAARADSPTTPERERVLAGVLAALQGLTGAHR